MAFLSSLGLATFWFGVDRMCSIATMMRRVFPAVATAAPGGGRRRLSTLPRYFEQPWKAYWGYGVPRPTDGTTEHPSRFARRQLRKNVQEWREYHGTGALVDDVAQWEFADGTPPPHRPVNHSTQHWEHKVLHQFIVAGAAVEALAAEGRLPRVPATQVQRDWDPQIPLFLEDADEHGKAAWDPATAADAPADAATEELTPLVVGETDPAAFVKEPYPTPERERPHWNRRLWGLTPNFLQERQKQRPLWNETE